MRLVVTGAKGFIGSVLSLRAAELGHEVLALDDGSRGLNEIEAPWVGEAWPTRVQFIKHDCMAGILEAVADGARRGSGGSLARTLVETRVDAVVHLAAATGSLDRPLDELREFNVSMMGKVYQDALDLGAKAFLWPTTSLALGVPDSPYVQSKEEGLAWLQRCDRSNRIAVPLRFFNVAGAYKGFTERRKREVHLIPTLFHSARSGRALPINGMDYETADGSPSRDFVHVLDVVEYLLELLRVKLAGDFVLDDWCAEDGAIWLGTGRLTTVLQAVTLAEQWLGAPVAVAPGPRRAFDCGALEVDPAQAEQFRAVRNGLAPAWVSIRDELLAFDGSA
jgi:UDP-glucose 4-epimerase